MQTIEEYKAYTQQLEGEVGKDSRAVYLEQHRADERRNKPVTQLRARREPATRKGRTLREGAG